MYLNRENKEKVATLFVLKPIFEHFAKQEAKAKELFGSKGWGWYKTSKTYFTKAMESFAETIGPDEYKKVQNLAKHSEFIVISRGVRPADPSMLNVKAEALHDLAGIAMGRECRECTKCNWKDCRLFQVMQAAEIPAAVENKKDCPYRQ